MPIEWVLNISTNRWGLNKKAVVGPVSEWIREIAPNSKEEWKHAYFKLLDENVIKKKKLNISPEEYLEEIGKKLYVKISEVFRAEIDDVSINDCISSTCFV